MKRRNTTLTSLAASALAFLGLGGLLGVTGLTGLTGWTGDAWAASGAIVTGEVEFITVIDSGDKWSGGTIVVGGQNIIIPRNILFDLPANRLTLQELFAQAPGLCQASGETGLAKGDSCNSYATGANVLIHANRTSAGNTIAGDVFIQKGIESVQGTVTFIDYDEGYFRLNGASGSDTTGVMVRLNDPDGRHTVQTGAGCAGGPNCSPDPRYTLDPDNYTNVFSTGYPLCIPSRVLRSFVDVLDLDTDNNMTETLTAQADASGNGDRLCPQTNRTVSGGQPVDDSRRLAPIRIGDTLTADGNFETINGVRFLSVHSIQVSHGLTTKNLPDQPDYMFLNEVEIDVAGFQNQRARTLIIGFATLAPEDVLIWSRHFDPVNNDAHELPLASSLGCEAAAGVGGCIAQGIPNPGAITNIFKIRHDVDFLTGADPKLNPCAHLLADPRFPAVCNGNAGGANIGEMLAILSPIPHEIQARTGHALANPGLIALDINGNEMPHGQYLFPFGIGLGGVSTPEFDEINLDLMGHPLMFSGIPWNLDRRVGPGGCDPTPCPVGPPIPLDPFPFEGLDPRTQATAMPTGGYNDPVYTSAPLSDVRNRIFSFVNPDWRAGGNSTVLPWPPINPPLIPILPTPTAMVCPAPPANNAPVITSTPILTATVGLLYTYQVTATDDGPLASLVYSLTTAPAGMTISATGLISWTPLLGQAPSQAVTVRVADAGALFDTQSYIITVNAPPVITSTPILTATVDVLYTYQVTATDVNGGPFTFSLDVAPAGMTISATGLISWTPTAAQVSPPTRAVTVRVTDNTALFATQAYSITVAAAPAGTVVIEAHFNVNEEAFTYADSTFAPAGAADTDAYESGVRVTAGGVANSGALSVTFGGLDNFTRNNMSGGWSRSFTLASPATLTLSFVYNLTLLPDYETDEFSDVRVSLDGTQLVPFVAKITGDGNGGPNQTTGLQTFNVVIPAVSAGSHTLTIGGFNNQKTQTSERTDILIDDVLLTQ